jgi:hypothetical protein
LFKGACTGDPAKCTKCLDLSNNGKTDNGNPIDIWDCDGGTPQQWQFNTDDGTIRYKADTTKCIDIPGGDMTNGNKLQIWDCDSSKKTLGQQWQGGGTYQYQSKMNANKCIDLYGGNSSDGNGIEIW